MKGVPVKVRNIFKTMREVRDEREASLRLVLAGEAKVDKEGLARRLASGLSYGEEVSFLELGEGRPPAEFTVDVLAADAVLIVAEETQCFSEPTALFISHLQQLMRPFLLVIDNVEGITDAQALVDRVVRTLNVPPNRIVFTSLRADIGIDQELAPRIADLIENKEVALAARFPVFRDAAADRVIRETAVENAFIGAISFLPGTDMPVLSANQVRMIMRLAAIYDQELTLARAREVLAVLGGGLTFRALAHQLLDLIPGPGWVIKSGVAHIGTVALGKAGKKYFGALSVDFANRSPSVT